MRLPAQAVVDAVLGAQYTATAVLSCQNKTDQPQYQTAWKPSLAPRWLLPYIKAAYPGRYSLEMDPLTPTHPPPGVQRVTVTTCDSLTCDICLSREGGDLKGCNTCGKLYHGPCLAQAGFAAPGVVPVSWECPACDSATGTSETRAVQCGDDLVRVQWLPSMQLEDDLCSVKGGPEALEAFFSEQQRGNELAAAARAARPDAHRPNDLRQHPAARDGHWTTTAGDAIRTKVQFVHERTNPQLDTSPTGRHELAVRDVQVWCPRTSTPAPPRPLGVSTGPDGCAIGTIAAAHLQALRDRFDAAAAAGLHSSIKPPVCAFEAEVASLLARCTAKENSEEWTAAPEVMHALSEAFGCTTEHISTPVLAHSCHGAYTSMHERDSAFGADAQPFSHLWSGTGIVCAGPDDAAMERAFKWATASAVECDSRGVPALTVLLLRCKKPKEVGSAFNRYPTMMPHMCTKIAELSKGAPTTQRHDTWATGLDPVGPQAVQVWLVWNNQASQAWRMHAERMQTAHATLAARLHARDAPTWALRRLQHSLADALGGMKHVRWCAKEALCDPAPMLATADLPRPKGLGKVKNAVPTARRGVPGPVPRGRCVLELYGDEHCAALPLRWDNDAIAFTDGSCKLGVCGAGLWLPARATVGEEELSNAPRTVTIDPAGEGPTNTITRAELSAIWAGLKLGATTIASDSACALWLIQKAVFNPMALARNRLHRPLLLAIVDLLRAAQGPSPA